MVIFFLPRNDTTDLLEAARDRNYHVISTREELLSSSSLPVLGLFADTHMDFEIDRTTQPSLSEMTAKALQLLGAATRDSRLGFALMVEGSRIDMACHNNDAAGAILERVSILNDRSVTNVTCVWARVWCLAASVRDTLEFQKVFEMVQKFAEARGDTLVLATADHEVRKPPPPPLFDTLISARVQAITEPACFGGCSQTGGLALGYQWTTTYPEYQFSLTPLSRVHNSSDPLTSATTTFLLQNNSEAIESVVLRRSASFNNPDTYQFKPLVSTDLIGGWAWGRRWPARRGRSLVGYSRMF